MGKLLCKKNGFQVWVFRLNNIDKKVSIRLGNCLKYSEWETLSFFLWSQNIQVNFRPTKRAVDGYLRLLTWASNFKSCLLALWSCAIRRR